jgi:hypothetical protein
VTATNLADRTNIDPILSSASAWSREDCQSDLTHEIRDYRVQLAALAK